MPTPIAKQLSEQEFFSGLPSEFIDFLAEHATERRIGRDEILFRHGDPASTFYLVRSGSISLEVPAISGPTLEVQQLGADNILGWSWLIAPYQWSFNALVQEDATLLEFDGKAILRRCESDPRFGYELLKRFSELMSERLDAARRSMMDAWNPPGFA